MIPVPGQDLTAFCETDASGQGPTLARRMVFRHLAFVYALKSGLRKDGDTYYHGYLHPGEVESVAASKNPANAILGLQAADLRTLRDLGAVDGFVFRDLNSRLTAFTDELGMCERIRNTPFPPSYLFFTRVFIWFYVIMTTFSLTENIGAWAILFSWAVGFVFHVTHRNGLSIMDPFDTDPLSLPLNSISRTIEINLLEMLGHSQHRHRWSPSANCIFSEAAEYGFYIVIYSYQSSAKLLSYVCSRTPSCYYEFYRPGLYGEPDKTC